MANPVPQNVITEIEQTRGVIASAIALIDGIKARVQAAVDQALANGATAEELAPVQAEVDALAESRQSLADAVAANA